MEDSANNINLKTGILLSRNTPVALVVGAAGFLGSHLVEDLLKRDIQVVGVDDFSSGKKQNLSEAVKNNKFHLINSSASSFEFEPPRIDYIFITACDSWSLDYVLSLAKNYFSKIVFISSIELYDRKREASCRWFKEAEGKIAQYAANHHLNARVLRLSAVFGPRMHFKIEDPVTYLIRASLKDELQKESVALEFSSRALFIDDAISLMVKSMLSGSTALKIFDGALLTPIKAVEIKQILLDPLWYENRGFTPAELPPWPTPNLEKTIKELNWHPQTDLVKALKRTINYFKENETEVSELELPKFMPDLPHIRTEKIIPWVEQTVGKIEPKETEIRKVGEGKKKLQLWRKSYLLLSFLVILYAFVYPLAALIFGVLTFRSQLQQASDYLVKGEFDRSKQSVVLAKTGVDQARYFLNSFEVTRKVPGLQAQFEAFGRLVAIADLITQSAKHSIVGTESLYHGLKTISGEDASSTKEVLTAAQTELNQAYDLSFQAQAELEDQALIDTLPEFLKTRVKSLSTQLVLVNTLLKKGQVAAQFLPQLVAVDGKRSYLVLLQNNNELRPSGGFIGSFAQINFENGKLQKIDVNDIYAIDGKLSFHVEPPKEIREVLGQKDWYLRDSNWEPDFPTSARQSKWFYNKETSKQVDGVIALDVSALEDLLSVTGPLNIADYNETVTADNLFQKAITHAEANFFPGSQAKKNFLTALTNQLFDNLFFVPNQNWPGIIGSLGRSMDNKHLLAYFDDPKLFSYLVSSSWAGTLPREIPDKEGVINDFLAPVEANLGANKANYYLERSYNLDTTIGKEGEVFDRLKVDYINRSPSEAWPAGRYKSILRVYLPFGSKLNRGLWGETEITSKISAFADYGRSGLEVSLEMAPKEHKALVLDYQLPRKLNFINSAAIYKINIIKQAGTLKDRFDWKLTYPLNYQLALGPGKALSPQEYDIFTDLSRDRTFELIFKK